MNAKPIPSIIDSSTQENPALAALEAWVSINRPMVSAISEINGRLIEQVSKANNEWLGFLNRRFTEDIAASQRLFECKTPQDLLSAYADFFQRAQAHYQAEIQYFSRLNRKMADETVDVMTRDLDDVSSELRH